MTFSEFIANDTARSLVYTLIFVMGTCVGSFLNVLIFRIPLKQEFAKTQSHCMTCGHKLAWYENIPLFSFIFLRGKCGHCGVKLSKQYPLVELLNGVLWLLSFVVLGITADACLVCLLMSALLALSVIDLKTFEIPPGFQYFILVLAVIRIILIHPVWMDNIIGMFAVSVPLAMIFYISKGRAIGGGDCKLMAVCGLFLGWKAVLLSLCIGCIAGSVIHIIRIKFFNAGRVLAMGPYLSLGIAVSALWGNAFLDWYIGML